MAKQYGLIIPNKDKAHKIGQVSSVKPSIFDEDSDSDTPKSRVTSASKNLKKNEKLNHEKAAQEDPTVFQYDEVYDEMDQKRKESKLARKDLERKPKYISRLLAAAEKRKRENERRIERQVQREREEEGEMYKDKESFVTSAYKKKLEEMKELDKQEQREEYLESIGDVRKQGNLDGFYRHLYDQKLNHEEKEDEVKMQEVEIKEESASEEEKNERAKLQDSISDGQSDDNEVNWKRDTKKRRYRKHRDSDEDEPEVKKEHLQSNLDADSDFSIDSSGSDEEKKIKSKPKKSKDDDQENKPVEVVASIATVNEEKSVEKTEVKEEEKLKIEIEKEVKVKKPKIDIWKKRTVGEKFDEAVKRYFERKALREMGH